MNITAVLRQLAQALLFPQACVLCEKWVLSPDFRPLCPECFASLERLDRRICLSCGVKLPGVLEADALCSACRDSPQPFDFARAYGPYEGRLRDLIHKFKFDGLRRLSYPLAELMEESYREGRLALQPHWIIPVPLHRRKRRERGYDQTLLLARVLSSRLKIPVFPGLSRIRATAPQYGLDVEARRHNISRAFTLASASPVGGDVLLVDDIFTTGTTVAEISRLLKRETEVKQIAVLTVARVGRLF